jgi:hypothetical protein
MAQFWIGISGDLTRGQHEMLAGIGSDLGLNLDRGLRQTIGGYGNPPTNWETLRTFVSVEADDADAAAASVAGVLGLKPGDVVAYSGDLLG